MKLKTLAAIAVAASLAGGAAYAVQDDKHLAYTDEVAAKCFKAGKHYMSQAEFMTPVGAKVNYGVAGGFRNTAEVRVRYHAPVGGWTTGRIGCTFDAESTRPTPDLVFMTVNGLWVDDLNTRMINLIVD